MSSLSGLPRVGDTIHIGRAASPQFCRPFFFTVTRLRTDRTTYEGWMWIEGYQLNGAGEAVERRELFVQEAGITPHKA